MERGAPKSKTTTLCLGDCFKIGPPQLDDSHPQPGKNNAGRSQPAQLADADRAKLYQPLTQWQTRVLRLRSRSPESADDADAGRIEASLITVNLYATGGAIREDTKEIITYQALSYVWGSSEAGYEIICNGIRMPVTPNLYYALEAIQQSDEASYLWIDAISIDQSNKHEQAEQVRKMLEIFQIAESVIAWLGPPGHDSTIAASCISDIQNLCDLIGRLGFHSEDCVRHLKAVYESLLEFYSRSWLSRTWIRQEVYAARLLVVKCGSWQMSWEEFIGCGRLLVWIRDFYPQLFSPEESQPESLLLLVEAEKNAPPYEHNSGPKLHRDLLEVIMKAKHYRFTKGQDVFYAVLGMCGVTMHDNPFGQKIPRSPYDAIRVDYNKTVSQVYQEATVYLLRSHNVSSYPHVWELYSRQSQHGKSLPTWTMDLPCTHLDDTAIEAIHNRWRPEHMLESGNASSIDIPEPLSSDPLLLQASGRAVNYVAYVTNYTCDFSDLSCIKTGAAGAGIHSSTSLRHIGRYQTLLEGVHFKDIRQHMTKFDETKHHTKIAVLGVGDYLHGGVALVPSTASKGDLVVSIGPEILPVLLRPSERDLSIGKLCPSNDIYESAPLQPTWRNAEVYLRLLFIVVGFVNPITALIVGIIHGYWGFLSLLPLVVMFCYLFWIANNEIQWMRQMDARRAAVLPALDKATAASDPFAFHGPIFVEPPRKEKVNGNPCTAIYRRLACYREQDPDLQTMSDRYWERPVQKFVVR